VLAEAIGQRLGLLTEGRVTPMLRETRSPAVVVAMEGLTDDDGVAAAEAVIQLYLLGVPQENNAR
jgi:hypothetical protein